MADRNPLETLAFLRAFGFQFALYVAFFVASTHPLPCHRCVYVSSVIAIVECSISACTRFGLYPRSIHGDAATCRRLCISYFESFVVDLVPAAPLQRRKSPVVDCRKGLDIALAVREDEIA